MATLDDEYVPSKEEQDDEDEETPIYYFMAKDQSEKVRNCNLENPMSFHELHSILNELMDEFHNVLETYFSISNENDDLIKEVSNMKENQLSLMNEKELLEKENKFLKQELAHLKEKNYETSKVLIVLKKKKIKSNFLT